MLKIPYYANIEEENAEEWDEGRECYVEVSSVVYDIVN